MASTPYRSPYGPKMKGGHHIGPFTTKSINRLAFTMGGFATVGVFALFFLAEGVPRVRRDILQKIPIIGSYWVREIPPSDNPF